MGFDPTSCRKTVSATHARGSIEQKKKKGGRCTCVLFASTWYSTTVQATFTCTVHGSRRIDPPASLLASEASLHVQLVASIVVIVAGSTRS